MLTSILARFLRKGDGMATRPSERTKTSMSLTPEAKFKLATIKAELRLRGHSVSESEVMEALLKSADAASVARILRLR